MWVNGVWIGWSEASSDSVTERWARITQRIVWYWITGGSVLADHLYLHTPYSFVYQDPPADEVLGTRTGPRESPVGTQWSLAGPTRNLTV